MKKTLSLLLITLVVVLPLLAQDNAKPAGTKPVEPLPTVDQILEKYVQALGGKAAAAKVTSVVMKGSIEVTNAGMSGTTEVILKAPDKRAMNVDLPGYGTVRDLFNGTAGWVLFPDGLREASGSRLAAMRREADLLHNYKLKDFYVKMIVKGKEKIGDREAYLIEATPAEGDADAYYFDIQTGLLVRFDSEADGPNGTTPSETYLEDYKDVNGIKYPFTLRQSTASYSLLVKFTEIKQNEPVDDAKFEKPPA